MTNSLVEVGQGQIVTVYPVAGGNGASYTALNLAYAMREKDPYASIAVVDFDFTNPYMGIALTTDNVHGIDNLVDKINGDFLDDEQFKENMIVLKDDVHLLKGSQLGHFDLVKQDHLTIMVDYLKTLYDVTFIATNFSASDIGTPVGLYVADQILLLGRYTSANAVLSQRAVETIRNYAGHGEVSILYNMYHNQNGIDFSEVFEGWPVLGTIPYVGDTVDNDHLSGKSLGGLVKRRNPSEEVYQEVLETIIKE